MPNRTRFLPISRIVISISSATMIFCSFLRLMISIRTHPLKKYPLTNREIPMAKKYIEFLSQICIRTLGLQFSVIFWHNKRAFHMMKYLLSTTCLILLLLSPIQAQENRERLLTVSGTNYLNQLALRGFDLSSQGILIESLDGRSVFADLNSNVGFNPASVIKVATSFAALSKLGPEYHFETGFYADGTVNKKTRTLNGDLILASAGDPVLTTIDVARLVHEVVRSGIARVTGNLIVTGPFSYGMFYTTDRATKALSKMLCRAGVRVGGLTNGGPVRGTSIASHVSESLRDILFYQNAHSTNSIADRLGEALGGAGAVEEFLVKDVGIPQSDVYISHTSGLDFNRITPRATVQLFRELVFWLNLSDLQPQDVLPVAGSDAGTLRRRFVGEEFRGAIIGKTGTLPGTDGGVSTLAGIAYTRNRGPVLFAILTRWDRSRPTADFRMTF